MNAITHVLQIAPETIREVRFWVSIAALAIVGILLTMRLCHWAARSNRQPDHWD